MWRGGQHQDQRRGWLRNNRSLLGVSPRRDEDDLERQPEAAPASEEAGTAAVAAGSVAAASAVVAVEGGAKPASPTGIGWVTILSVFLTQVSFVGLLFWLATPAIRELKERRRGRAQFEPTTRIVAMLRIVYARNNSNLSPFCDTYPASRT